MKAVVFVICMSMYSCTSEPRAIEMARSRIANDNDRTVLSTTQTVFYENSARKKREEYGDGYPPPAEHPREVGEYEYKNDTLLQRLQVKWIRENRITYTLFVTNTVSKCSTTVSGTAITDYTGGDPDLDEDDKGLAYPTVYYYDKNPKQPINISIEMNSRDMAHVFLDDSLWRRKEGCPLESVRVMWVKE